MKAPIHVLLVEDNPADVMLTQVAFEEAAFPHELHCAPDGVEALAFLRREGEYANVPMPDVILMDLNMPRLSGMETLDIIKADPHLRRIPVIVLTTSRAEEDIWRSYDLHANAYIPKPVSISEFVEVIRNFEHFWVSTATLPPQKDK
ncbi:response regulator [Deinococcus fonticola]|uniref:response regulator n=1 Tax=Deinococcus fonticola TaxID=2528713 RepID=UPI003B82E367